MPEDVPTDVLRDFGPLCRRSDVIPLDGFRPKWLATLHALAGKNPVLVSGIRRFGTPTQQISDHFVIKRHDLFAFLRFHWPHMLLPNRLSDIQSLLREVDIAPLCCQQFAPSHPSGNIEKNESPLSRSQFGKEPLKLLRRQGDSDAFSFCALSDTPNRIGRHPAITNSVAEDGAHDVADFRLSSPAAGDCAQPFLDVYRNAISHPR